MSLITLVAIGTLGYFTVVAAQRSIQYPKAQHKEPGDRVPSSTGYMELKHVAWDPALITFNHNQMWKESEEVGPFGVPRVMYTDASGWVVPTYGYNFDKM